MPSKTTTTAAQTAENAAVIAAAVSTATPRIREALADVLADAAPGVDASGQIRDIIGQVAADLADNLSSDQLTAVVQQLQDAFDVTPENRPEPKKARAPRKPAAAPAGNGVTAKDLQSDSYTVGQLRTMVRTTKNAETKKLAQAEIDRRAELARQAAKAKNKAAVKPAVAEAAKAKTAAATAANDADRDKVLAFLKENPNASAPDTFRATGVSYSRVRKIAEAAGHRFAAQDRSAGTARVLTPAEAKTLKGIEEKMGASLSTLAAALKRYDAS